jgi:hypothetical protein
MVEPITAPPCDLCGRYLQPLDGKAVGDTGGGGIFAMNILFLQPSGKFLMCATWPGYEYLDVTGPWSHSGQQIHLKGQGVAFTDVGNGCEDEVYERVFDIIETDGVRSLKTDVTLEQWSLLSYPGTFKFIGHENIGVSKKWKFPESTDDIEQRIAEVLSWIQQKS